MPTWLNSQKKARLAELAEMCNIGTAASLVDWRKDQLVPALEEKLSTMSATYSRNPAFEEYYQRRNSPIKRSSSVQVSGLLPSKMSTVTNGAARISHPKSDGLKAESSFNASEESLSPLPPSSQPLPTLSSPSVTAAATRRPAGTVSRTPARPRETLAAAVPLPASPAVVADMIEAQAAKINAEVGELWQNTHIVELLNSLRVEMSSMAGVHLLLLALEYYHLQSTVTVWRYAFDLNTPFYTRPIYYPDVFVYLTGYWLTLLGTWMVLSFWIPLAVAWVCNLTLKLKARNGQEYWRPRYRVDPVTYSVTKGLLAWLVFMQGSTLFGILSTETVARVLQAQPAGFQGIVISSGVGVILALWDGIQGKKGWQ